MTKTVTDQNGIVHNFPDEATPAMIAEAMGVSLPSKAMAPGATSPTAPQTPPPSGAAQTESSEPNPYLQKIRNMAEAATFGHTGEISNSILKHVLPDSYSPQLDQIAQKRTSDLQKWRDENPIDSFIGTTIGSAALVGSGGELLKSAGNSAGALMNSALPEAAQSAISNGSTALSNFASQFEAAHPYIANAGKYLASAGSGAATGGAIGYASDGQNGAEGGAVGGAFLGPLARFANRNILPSIVDSAEKTGSALQDWLTKSEGEPANAAALAPQAAAEQPVYSNITDQPLSTVQRDKITGELPLSPGVKARDPNLLRVEESAKQGNLGKEAQDQKAQLDAKIMQASKNVAQYIKGDENAPAHELFESAIQQFQDVGEAAHRAATALYNGPEGLNAAAAITTLAKNKVGPSLGTALSKTVNDPNNIRGFNSGVGKDLYEEFNNIIKSTKGNELPANDLLSWRQKVSDAAGAMQKDSGTTAASKLGEAFDDYMADIPQGHVLSGDPSFAEKARAAAAGWKEYKTSFNPKASPFMPGESKPFDMTPADHAAKLFPASGIITATAARQVRGMVAALPTEEARQQFQMKLLKGFVDRAANGLNQDLSSLVNFRNSLQTFKKSQLYREQFSTLAKKLPEMADKDAVLGKVIDHLNQQIQESGRRDVVSPSGGAVIRGLRDLMDIPAKIPIVNAIPGVKMTAHVSNLGADASQNYTDRKVFNAALKKAVKESHAAARSAPVFDLNSLKAGVLGGISAGAVVQTNKKEKVK